MDNYLKEEFIPLLPTTDILFKRIFGFEGNEEITKSLVSSILGKKVEKLEFKNPIMNRRFYEDKEEIFDIKMSLDDDTMGDIEIQVVNYHDDDKRFLEYWSKMFLTSISKGEKYSDMKKTIVILISNYELDSLKGIKEYLTRWKVMEETLKIPLTDVLELDILELPKAKIALNNGQVDTKGNLKNWIKFLINPYERSASDMDDIDEELKKAYEILNDLNSNAEERERIERRIMDLRSLRHAKEYEYNQGLEKGAKEKQIEIARNMKQKKVSIEMIIEFTKLTKDEIENL